MKTYYHSEILNKTFDTEEACIKAENEYEEKHAAELKAKEERTAAAKEVTEAYKTYIDLRTKFIEKYGTWHCTLTEKDLPSKVSEKSLLELIYDLFSL